MIMQNETGRTIAVNRYDLAGHIADIYFRTHPGLEERHGSSGKNRCLEETLCHLDWLAQAINCETPQMFALYIEWSYHMLKSRHIPPQELNDHLDVVSATCRQLMEREQADVVEQFLQEGLNILQAPPAIPPTFLGQDIPLLDYTKKYLSLLLEGQKKAAASMIHDLRVDGATASDIYEQIFVPVQQEIGRLWHLNVISVAHEHYCTATTRFLMNTLYPSMFSGKSGRGKLVSCTVSSDLHDLGIRMVTDYFEMNGWDTYYMGADVPAVDLVDTLHEHKADVLALSVTLPVHIGRAGELIGRIRRDRELDSLRIVVGGYSFRLMPGLWKKIGASGYAENAGDAVRLVRELDG